MSNGAEYGEGEDMVSFEFSTILKYIILNLHITIGLL